MKEVISDTLIDVIKLLPFLFVAFLIMELIEHKMNKKGKKRIENSGKLGPLFGGLLGSIPQCGFSVLATNLYATRIISLGTLFSIYLSTSDEMLPILISKRTDIKVILLILFIKVIIGILYGFLIDLVFRKNKKNNNEIRHLCEEEHCDCEHSIFLSVLRHTLNIGLFIFLVTFGLNLIIHFSGREMLEKLFLKDTIFSPFLSSLIGLIPNCAASVFITELYLNKALSLASCISGLLTGSGVGLLVLFKQNKDLKENIRILIMLYLLGSITGLIVEFTSFLM